MARGLCVHHCQWQSPCQESSGSCQPSASPCLCRRCYRRTTHAHVILLSCEGRVIHRPKEETSQLSRKLTAYSHKERYAKLTNSVLPQYCSTDEGTQANTIKKQFPEPTAALHVVFKLVTAACHSTTVASKTRSVPGLKPGSRAGHWVYELKGSDPSPRPPSPRRSLTPATCSLAQALRPAARHRSTRRWGRTPPREYFGS